MNAAVLKETGGPPVYADFDEPLRANNVDVLGRAVFHAPLEVRRDVYRQLTEHAANGDITVSREAVPLADVVVAWERQRAGAGPRLVLVP